MNMWNILQIEKTKDVALIKSAFVKARNVAPAQESKLLSSQYEFATRCAGIKDSTDSYKEEMILEMASENFWRKFMAKTYPDRPIDAASDASRDVPVKRTALLDEYMAQIQKVYDNFFLRRDVANWEPLVTQNAILSSSKKELEPLIQEFFTLSRSIPKSVWNLFDGIYEWSMNVCSLITSNPPFARRFLIETCSRWPLDYSFVARDSGFDYESYFKFRGLTREAALENNLELVRVNFDASIDIYTNDPALYQIVADFFAGQPASSKYGEFGPEFLHALNKLIKLHYDDAKYIRERAAYYRSSEYFDEARDDYEQAMKLSPEDLRLPYEIADMYNMQNMSGKAKPYYKYIKKIYQQTQSALEKKMSTALDRDKISEIIDANDVVIGEVFEHIK